jgi:hypothetical protein
VLQENSKKKARMKGRLRVCVSYKFSRTRRLLMNLDSKENGQGKAQAVYYFGFEDDMCGLNM